MRWERKLELIIARCWAQPAQNAITLANSWLGEKKSREAGTALALFVQHVELAKPGAGTHGDLPPSAGPFWEAIPLTS